MGVDHPDDQQSRGRGNGRIVQYTPEGQFVKELGKPRSKLLEEDQVYQPNKLVIDRRGYIYVLNGGGDYRGIFLLDSEGEFRGFFGANRLKFDVMRLMIRTFTTEAQKKQISKVLPTHHANLFTDARGLRLSACIGASLMPTHSAASTTVRSSAARSR